MVIELKFLIFHLQVTPQSKDFAIGRILAVQLHLLIKFHCLPADRDTNKLQHFNPLPTNIVDTRHELP